MLTALLSRVQLEMFYPNLFTPCVFTLIGEVTRLAGRSYDGDVSTPEFLAPLFYFTDDTYSFDSIAAMLGFIEPWDVQRTDLGFDAKGRRLALSGGAVVRGRLSVGGGETVLDNLGSRDGGAGELEELLRQFVRSTPMNHFSLSEPQLEELTLDELVQIIHPVTCQR